MTQVWPGTAYPLGATYDGTGTNFALFSEVAERVELCLFDEDGTEERVELPEVDGYVWHGYLPGIQPGQRYGFRVHGPYDPDAGAALQPGQAAARPVRQGDRRRRSTGTSRCFGYHFGDPDARNDDGLGAAHAEVRRRQPVLRLGRRPAAQDRPTTRRSSTRPTSRA